MLRKQQGFCAHVSAGNTLFSPSGGWVATHHMELCPIAPGLRALDCGYFLCEQKVTKESLRGRLRASFPPLRSGHDAFALPLRTPVRTRPPYLCFAIRFCVVSVCNPVIAPGSSERRCDRSVTARLCPDIVTEPEVNRRVLPLAPLSLTRANTGACAVVFVSDRTICVSALRRHLPREPSEAGRGGRGRRNGA